MIASFSVENFRTYNKQQELPTYAVEHKSTEALTPLKVSLVYGANESGKSNLIDALEYLQLTATEFIDSSLFDPFDPGNPTSMEVYLVLDGHMYCYGLSVYHDTIEREWLYDYHAGRRRKLFVREKNTCVWSKTYWKPKTQWTDVPNGQSVLSLCAVENHPTALSVFTYLKSKILVLRSGDLPNKEYFQPSGKVAKWIDLFKKMDFSCTEILWLLSKPYKVSHSVEEPSLLRQFFVDWKHESKGLNDALAFVPPIFESIENGGTVVIDDFDSHIHPTIIREILRTVQASTNHTQIIATVKNQGWINHPGLNPESVFLVDLDKKRNSVISSLCEFKKLDKKKAKDQYIHGCYGAVPFVNIPFPCEQKKS